MSKQNAAEPFVRLVGDVFVEQCADGHLVVHTDRAVEVQGPDSPGSSILGTCPDGHVVLHTDREVEIHAPRRAYVVEYGSESERDSLNTRFGKAVMNDLPDDHRLMISMTAAEVADLEGTKHHVQRVQWHGVTCS